MYISAENQRVCRSKQKLETVQQMAPRASANYRSHQQRASHNRTPSYQRAPPNQSHSLQRQNRHGNHNQPSQLNQVIESNTADNDTDSQYVLSVHNTSNASQLKVNVKINGQNALMMIDSGSYLDIIDESTLSTMNMGLRVTKCKHKLYGYARSVIPTIGQFSCH